MLIPMFLADITDFQYANLIISASLLYSLWLKFYERLYTKNFTLVCSYTINVALACAECDIHVQCVTVTCAVDA